MEAMKRLLGLSSTAPLETGIARGEQAGHVTVWAIWPESVPEECFRVRVQFDCPNLEPLNTTYTFLPSFNHAFAQSLEFSLSFRDRLRGRHFALEGSFQFTLLFQGGKTQTFRVPLNEALKYYRHKGRSHPEQALCLRHFSPVDPVELSQIPDSLLKEKSDLKRVEIEEKQKRLEEEKRKAEELAKAKLLEAQKAKEGASKEGKAATVIDKSKPTLSPAKVGLFYGSSTGNTADIAEMIKKELGDAIQHVKNITDLSPMDFTICEILILGVPTWHIGEMQDDWAAFLPDLDPLEFKGKKIAIFGLGDGKGYPDTYVDAMQELWVKFEKRGATLVGLWPTQGYEYKASKAIKDGKFMGLVIDVENQHHLSESRVKGWVQQLKSELGI